MRWITTAVGLVLFFVLFTASPVLAAETKEAEEDEEQIILLPGQTVAELTEKGTLFKFTGFAVFAASSGDLVSTEWGLTQPGISEGNPIASKRSVRIATHVLAPAIVWWTTEKMHQSGNKKLALALRIGLMVAYSYATVHNLHAATNP
jgi:hypothetical protein